MSWNGDERRSSLNTHEQVIILKNQFDAITERITSHKKAQDEGFKQLQESVDRIESVLIPRDGKPSIPEQIRVLQSSEETRKNIIKIAIGGVASLCISIAIWLGKIFLVFFKNNGVQ